MLCESHFCTEQQRLERNTRRRLGHATLAPEENTMTVETMMVVDGWFP